MVSGPALQALFEALGLLRDAPEPLDASCARAWRVVSEHLHRGGPSKSADEEDTVQEVLITLARCVQSMRATTPEGAAAWLSTIRRRKRTDGARSGGREPALLGLRGVSDQPEAPSPLDALPSPDPRTLPPDAVERLIDTLESHVDRWLLEHERSATARQLKRLQARATLHRTLLGAGHAELVAALDADEPLSEDRVYKWVERGRAVVLAGLGRWQAEVEDDPDDRAFLRSLREAFEARRSDAGVARPERRRGA